MTIIGAGVIGVCTAYYLADAGCQVTLIDRHAKAAMESSYGNAGLYSPSDALAWASPDALKILLKSLVQPNLPIRYRFRIDPALWGWSARFLRHCNTPRMRENSLRKLRLALHSRACLDELIATTGIEFDRSARGILYGYRDRHHFDHAIRDTALLVEHGLHLEVIESATQMRAIEPALAYSGDRFCGGLYAPSDTTGDSHRFSNALIAWLERHDRIECRFDTLVHRLVADGERIRSVHTDRGDIDVDQVVIASGALAPRLVRPLGVRLPIYPVKGYSMTVPIRAPEHAPSGAVVDEQSLVAITPLGDRLRVTSTAEFTGFDRRYRERDFHPNRQSLAALFPDAVDATRAEYWAGFRPMSPSSVPILGRAKFRNLFLNSAHGHLGWTFSCGSAQLLSDLLCERTPRIDPEGLLYQDAS